MESINFDQIQISSGWTPSSKEELENQLDNLFSSSLDALRGTWDLSNSANVLLSLIFYKRLICLQEEGELAFIKISEKQRQILHNFRQQLAQNEQQAFGDLRDALVAISRANPSLENIFAPLMVALQDKADAQHLARVFGLLEQVDFSLKQFSIAQFGAFFNKSLSRAAQRRGKAGGSATSPLFLNKLMALLLSPKSGESVYEPAAGQAGSLVALMQEAAALNILAQEVDQITWAFCKMNLLMNGAYEAVVEQNNSLLHPPQPPQQFDLALANFPFGEEIDLRAVKQRSYVKLPLDVGQEETDCNSLFVQLMLEQLNENGRMIAVLPMRALFKERQERRLREYLLRCDVVDAAITLPPGLLYASQAPICLLYLHKNKPVKRKGKVLFINASQLQPTSKSRVRHRLESQQIAAIVSAYHSCGEKVPQELAGYVVSKTVEQLLEQRANLNAKRYAAPFIQELEALAEQNALVKLQEVMAGELPALWVHKKEQQFHDYPFVSSRDLALQFADYQLALPKLCSFEEQEEEEGRILQHSAFLVNRKGRRLRASYFEYTGQAIIVSKSVLVFDLQQKKINKEYFLVQLHQKLFLAQFNMFRTDHEALQISEREFGQLQMPLLSLEEQIKLVQETKWSLLKEEEHKVETLRSRLNLDKQTAQNRQMRIISSLQHELGNRLPAILTELKNIKDFLGDKIEEQTPLSWSDSIYPLFEGEEAEEEDQLGKVVRKIEQQLIYTINSIDAASNIISADKERMQLEQLVLRNFLEDWAQLYAQEKQFSIQIEVEDDERGRELPIATLIDRAQLATALSNFVENARRHGFSKHKKHLIRFSVSLLEEQEEVLIEYKNDGKAFPNSFTFDDFVSYGNYAGDTGHSGIGGYLIHQIIENHEGSLYYKEQIDKSDPFKVQFDIILPYRK